MAINGTAKLVNRKPLTEEVYEFTFEMVVPGVLHFEAGQYIAIKIDESTRRQYSISSAPETSMSRFEIIVDIKPDGIGVNYLMGLTVGDAIDFIGEIGLFVLPDKLPRDIFFIATGVGLAPLKSMIESLVTRMDSAGRNIHMCFGTRHQSNVLYRELFNGYIKSAKLASYKIFLSREANAGYIRGYVSEFIHLHNPEILKTAVFFLCGSGEMIHGLKKLLLGIGVKDSQIFYEKFY